MIEPFCIDFKTSNPPRAIILNRQIESNCPSNCSSTPTRKISSEPSEKGTTAHLELRDPSPIRQGLCHRTAGEREWRENLGLCKGKPLWIDPSDMIIQSDAAKTKGSEVSKEFKAFIQVLIIQIVRLKFRVGNSNHRVSENYNSIRSRALPFCG